MLVLECKLKGKSQPYAKLDETSITRQLIRNCYLKHGIENKNITKKALHNFCAVLASYTQFPWVKKLNFRAMLTRGANAALLSELTTCSIVGLDGTVKARKFINPARDIDRRDQRSQRIATRSKLTRKIINQDLPSGFCQGLYRKSKNINKHIAQTVSREMVDFAKDHKVSVIVFEDLSNWKAKGGKHGSLQKQRFHQWCKDKLVELTIQKFSELGGTVKLVNPKYTSRYAFDGSGEIKRSNKKYSQAIFQNGKRYNAGLSASYNIGARYWYAVLTNSKSTRIWEGFHFLPDPANASDAQYSLEAEVLPSIRIPIQNF